MNDDVKDRALREAGAHLTKAIQALHAVGAYGLAADVFTLSDRVLKARRELKAHPQASRAITV